MLRLDHPIVRRCTGSFVLLGLWFCLFPAVTFAAVHKARHAPSAHSGPAHPKAAHTALSRTAARSTGRALSGHGRATNRRAVAAPATRPARSLRTAARPTRAVRIVRGRHGLRRIAILQPARPVRYAERFYASSFADNLTQGDMTDGEDPTVRAAAIEALGNMNGTALAIDPGSGRILAMVNQKLALSHGAEPCSTIKLTVALAALQEGIVTRSTPVSLGHGYHVTLTEALAHSNNLYFETLGRALGFERVKHYANQLGLGELAGYNIPGEQLGTYPDQELPASLGGVGRMCSFGESVSMTPLQLGAIVGAIANGGTLFYLQHPRTPAEVQSFQPRVKRMLDIGTLVPEMQDGMVGATQYGTARSLRANFTAFPVLGKTGTCSNNGIRFGWFGSYANTPNGRIVTVIFLEGGKPTYGPKAAELTGQFYRALYDKSYFAPKYGADSSSTGTR